MIWLAEASVANAEWAAAVVPLSAEVRMDAISVGVRCVVCVGKGARCRYSHPLYTAVSYLPSFIRRDMTPCDFGDCGRTPGPRYSARIHTLAGRNTDHRPLVGLVLTGYQDRSWMQLWMLNDHTPRLGRRA